MSTEETQELLDLSQRLLDSIATGDWETYTDLCDESLTAYEPEARGNRVSGLQFHRFYFDGEGPSARAQASIIDPEVRIMGECALVTYVRLTQRESSAGFTSGACEETRVWQMKSGRWQHVHCHRSVPS